MQVNLACPGCGLSQTLDPTGLPPGAQFGCPQCPTRFRVNANGEIEASRTPKAPPPAARASVDCPSCGHHFGIALPVPRSAPPLPAAPGSMAPRPTQQMAPAAPAVGPPITLPTILVVEDTAFFRELVKEALGSSYRVLLCSSKAEALHLIATEPLDLLLLDLSLDEDVDGREVLKEMGPKTFSILVFTARDESDLYGEVWEDLQRLGADDMLIKGMNVADNLLSKIEELLGATRV